MRLVYGVAVNDLQNMSATREYQLWVDMIKRSKSENLKNKRKTYIDVDCSDDWLLFSKFLKDVSEMKGFENKKWQLDKDILVKGNKIYSKETCCFIPREINNLFIKSASRKGDYPTGVYFDNYLGKFRACISVGKKQIKYGMFNDPDLAFLEYKRIKEDHIKDVANRFKGDICPRVYKSLINYEVSIND